MHQVSSITVYYLFQCRLVMDDYYVSFLLDLGWQIEFFRIVEQGLMSATKLRVCS